MKKYLLPENGNFYKANLHCHTTLSDGQKTPEQVKEIYKSLGYSVVAYTDHDILIPHPELCDEEFLALNGFETETNEAKDWGDSPKTCHACYIALEQDNIVQPNWHRTKYLFGNAPKSRELVKFDESLPDFERSFNGECMSKMMQNAREKGFFVTYNHPSWSLEDYRDYMSYNGMHAFEIFNGSCICSGYEDYNPRVYDDMLRGGKRIYCIGADDNHNFGELGTRRSDSGWAYTVIKAERLEYRAITRALEQGNFYASEGPEIKELWYENGMVHIKCSAADRVNCNYDMRCAQTVLDESGEGVCEATFKLPEKCEWFRLTVVDKSGKHACTNAFFKDELE